MRRGSSGTARAAIAVLVLLLAPLLVAAESWHTCDLPGIRAGGAPRVGAPGLPGAAFSRPCLACALTRRVPSPPSPAVPATTTGGRGLPLSPHRTPATSPPAVALPPGRAPPA